MCILLLSPIDSFKRTQHVDYNCVSMLTLVAVTVLCACCLHASMQQINVSNRRGTTTVTTNPYAHNVATAVTAAAAIAALAIVPTCKQAQCVFTPVLPDAAAIQQQCASAVNCGAVSDTRTLNVPRCSMCPAVCTLLAT
jgi:hypothetical protein